MELSQEFLIDMAINAGGYLLAGIISIICYAMMQKKKSVPTFEEVVSDKQNLLHAIRQPQAIEPSSDRKVEFIAFGNEQSESTVLQKTEVKNVISETSSRMSRKEAISLAKKMLLAGATHEKIKRNLPVSESELALLSLNNK